MGNSIDKIDDGLFICGADALFPYDRLHQLGIKCILNAAQKQLYLDHRRIMSGDSVTLEDIEQHFDVKIIGAEDAENCNLSLHFSEIADFIQAGRAKGGVVVHCAAGISRATSSCLAYMMIKEHWQLNAGFMRIQAVRNFVHPNQGFWRQLRDLEASMIAQGVDLKALPSNWKEMIPPKPESSSEDLQTYGFLGQQDRDPVATMNSLDEAANRMQSFVTKYLVVRITPKDGVTPQQLVRTVQETQLTGTRLENVLGISDLDAHIRVGVVPTMTSEGLQAILTSVSGVEKAACEASNAD